MKKFSLCCAFAAAFGVLHAQTISTYTEAYMHPLQNYTGFADSFAAPGPTLLDYEFGLAGDPTNSTLSISIYQWSASTFYGSTVGNALYTHSIVRPTADSNITLSNIDVPMTTGVEYAAVFQTYGNLNNSVQLMSKFPINTNPTGNLFTWDTFTDRYDGYGYDTEFKATFGAVPEAPPLAILGLGVIGLFWRRRR
jgi:hypothetical protein